MGGGLLQLAAYGAENEYITGNPQITYFKLVYRRHTNFAVEMIDMALEGPDELSFNQSVKLKTKIPRNGDLITQMYFKFKIPDILSNDTEQFYWTKSLGVSLIDYVDLFIGGYKVERLYGEYLNIISNLELSDSKKRGYDNMVGEDRFMSYEARYKTGYYPGYDTTLFRDAIGEPLNHPHLSSDPVYINKFYDSPPPIFERYITVPLHFWFSKNTGLALPLIALQYHDVEIEIQLKPVKDLYTLLRQDKKYFYYKNKNHYKDSGVGLHTSLNPSKVRTDMSTAGHLGEWTPYYRDKPGGGKSDHISNFIYNKYTETTWAYEPILDINYVFLDTDERKVFAQIAHEYLIQQVYKVSKKGQQGSCIVELEAFHPVKEILFTATRSDNADRNEWLNYTTRPYKSGSGESKFDFHDSWWNHCIDVSTSQSTTSQPTLNGPINFIHSTDGLITCDRFQELIFRFGPYGEAGDTGSANGTILGFSKLPKHELYTLEQLGIFKNTWLFNKAETIPKITHSNYKQYTDNPLINARLKFNGQTRQDTRRVEYYSQMQPYQHHTSMPNNQIYTYSFSLNPEQYQPSGTCNFSRIKTIELEMLLKNTPLKDIKNNPNNQNLSYKMITHDYHYDLDFYIVNYNVLKIMSGLAGLVFSS